MNIDELYNEFNLFYNNISSNQAPGLDKYEISVYLTKAQDMLVDALYGEFEKSEEARRKLANLVVTKKLTIASIATDNIIYPEYATVYSKPDDVRYIVNEQLRMKTNDNVQPCIKGKVFDVQPILHDEIDSIVENPFRFNSHRALRLDVSNGTKEAMEILVKEEYKPYIDYYQIRYVKNPNPIMIYRTTDPESDMTINGLSTTADGRESSLIPELHRRLIELAAKLAYQDYKV